LRSFLRRRESFDPALELLLGAFGELVESHPGDRQKARKSVASCALGRTALDGCDVRYAVIQLGFVTFAVVSVVKKEDPRC
jgi:hypothetical protein